MTIVCFANDGFVAIPVLFQFGTTESGILRVFYIFVCYLERTKITDQVIAARLNKVFCKWFGDAVQKSGCFSFDTILGSCWV